MNIEHSYTNLLAWERAKLDAARAAGIQPASYICTDNDAEALFQDIRNSGGSNRGFWAWPNPDSAPNPNPNHIGQWQGVQIIRGAAESFFCSPGVECHKKTPEERAAEKAAEEAKPNPLKVAKGLIEDAQHTGTHDRVLLLQEARAWFELSKVAQP